MNLVARQYAEPTEKLADLSVAQARALPAHTVGTAARLRRMRTMILATTILSCLAAIVLTLARHQGVVSASDRTSRAFLAAVEIHAVLSDADRAVWASFRSGQAHLLGPGQ